VVDHGSDACLVIGFGIGGVKVMSSATSVQL
jgi:hypothetical protein